MTADPLDQIAELCQLQPEGVLDKIAAVLGIDKVEAQRDLFADALREIALAGMSGTGQESEEGMRDWHARRAWEFIGIAARALSAPKDGVGEVDRG